MLNMLNHNSLMSYALEIFGTTVRVDTPEEAIALAQKVAEIQKLKCTNASPLYPNTNPPMVSDPLSIHHSFELPTNKNSLRFFGGGPSSKFKDFSLSKHFSLHSDLSNEFHLPRTETHVPTPLLRKTLAVLKLISAAGDDGVETTQLMDLLETESPRGVGAKFRPIRTVLQGMGYENTDTVFHVNREGGDEASWHAGPAIKNVIGQLEEWEKTMT